MHSSWSAPVSKLSWWNLGVLSIGPGISFSPNCPQAEAFYLHTPIRGKKSIVFYVSVAAQRVINIVQGNIHLLLALWEERWTWLAACTEKLLWRIYCSFSCSCSPAPTLCCDEKAGRSSSSFGKASFSPFSTAGLSNSNFSVTCLQRKVHNSY